MKINIDKKLLQEMIEKRYISVQKHPVLDLYIYNYTHRAQFDRVWNEATLQCRGLILDGEDNVIARPFRKFFNYAEAVQNGEQMPAEDFIVTEKMDGSLGILYWDGVRPCIATRGSFISEQAIEGTAMLPIGDGAYWEPGFTYLFEIIYPENRIVVDYGQRRELVLLAAIYTDINEEVSYEDLLKIGKRNRIKVVQKYDGIRDFTNLEDRPNSEGYVITFMSGQRYKIKHDEYVRLHRLVTGVNSKNIWELLRNDQKIDELLDRVPDEFYNWVRKTKEGLEAQFREIEERSFEAFKDADANTETAKDFALYTLDRYKDLSPLLFARKNGKPLPPIIWKMIKPKAERPFKEDIDA